MQNYIALDLETTGLSPESNEIIEIGAWKIQDGCVTDKFCTLVRPLGYVNSEITRITGITQEMLASECTLDEVLPAFKDFCAGYPFLGHNIDFDYKFLCNKGSRMLIDFSENRTRMGIDTLDIAKRVLDGVTANYKLKTIAEFFKIDVGNTANYHRAGFDAYMTKLIYDRFLYLYPNVAGVSVPTLLDRRENKIYGKIHNAETLPFE